MRRPVVTLAIASCISLAHGQERSSWPSQPITFVVPFAAGGPANVIARILASGLSEPLGQQVIVENVGGPAA